MSPSVSKFLFTALVAATASSLSAQPGGPAAQGPSGSVSFNAALVGGVDLEMDGVAAEESPSSYAWEFSTQWSRSLAEGRFTIGLNQMHVGFDIADDAMLPLRDSLNAFTVDMSYMRQLDDRWSLMLMADPGWRNAGTSLEMDGLSTTAVVAAGYAPRRDLRFMFGLAYDSLAPNEHRFMPGFGLSWQIDERWSLSLGFPDTSVVYKVDERLALFLRAEGAFGSFYIAESDLDSELAPLVGDSVLEYSEARIGLGAKYQVQQSLSVYGAVGALVYRQFDYQEADVEVDSDGVSAYASFGLEYSF